MADDCPKCGAARDETRTHCPKCGLAHAKMTAFAKTRDDVPASLAAAWQRALDGWDDPARHDEVLRVVTQLDAYAWAAAHYRDRLQAKPDDAVATHQLDRVKRAAEATLLANAATRAKKLPEPYRNTMVVLGIMIIAIIAGLVYALARGRENPDVPARVPVPPQSTK